MTEPTKEPSQEQLDAWHQEATGGTKTLDLPCFAKLAFAAGRKAGMEEAAKICDTEWSGDSDTLIYTESCNDCAMNGRWFVLRDAPDDVVANIAALEIRDEDAPELHQLVGDANAELALRLKTLKHELEEAIADAEVKN